MISNYTLDKINQALWIIDTVEAYYQKMLQSKFNRKWKMVKQNIQTERIDDTWVIVRCEGCILKNNSDEIELTYSEKKKWYLRTSPSKQIFLQNLEYQGIYKLWQECCDVLNHD